MGETIHSNNMPDKLERMQLKKNQIKREGKREKQSKITECYIGNRQKLSSSGVFTELTERLSKKREY